MNPDSGTLFTGEVKMLDAEVVFDRLAQIARMLRETAAGLDDKTIHPAHAANRLRKMARGIDGGK